MIGGAAVMLWAHVPMQGVGVLCGAGGSTGIHREAPAIELVQLYEAVCLLAAVALCEAAVGRASCRALAH